MEEGEKRKERNPGEQEERGRRGKQVDRKGTSREKNGSEQRVPKLTS